jgi:hypothetical protein
MGQKPTSMFSKPVVDPANTAAWFTMDALWLAKFEWPAYAAAAVTVLTGILLLILGRREGRGAVYADLGLNCWIVMNTVWLIHDLNGRDTRVRSSRSWGCSAPSSSSPRLGIRKTFAACESSGGLHNPTSSDSSRSWHCVSMRLCSLAAVTAAAPGTPPSRSACL